MKQFILRRKDLKVRKHLPSRLVVERPHAPRKQYSRTAIKRADRVDFLG